MWHFSPWLACLRSDSSRKRWRSGARPIGAIIGPVNRFDPVCDADATRALLECVLFFAHDSELVARVFDSVCEMVPRVPIRRLTFVPDSRVWEGIQ